MKFVWGIAVAFLVAAVTAILTRLLEGGGTDPDTRTWIGTVFSVTFFVALAIVWCLTAFGLLNKSAEKALAELGDQGDKSDEKFRQVIGKRFGTATVEGIFSYELHCRNEYKLDMERHHLSWVILSISAIITIAVSAYIIYRLFSDGENDLPETIVVGVLGALPSIVTGIFYKIWTQTRENLRKTRSRSDTLQRQRVRLLLLAEDDAFDHDYAGLAKNIELKTLLVHFLGLRSATQGDEIDQSDKT